MLWHNDTAVSHKICDQLEICRWPTTTIAASDTNLSISHKSSVSLKKFRTDQLIKILNFFNKNKRFSFTNGHYLFWKYNVCSKRLAIFLTSTVRGYIFKYCHSNILVTYLYIHIAGLFVFLTEHCWQLKRLEFQPILSLTHLSPV